MISIRTRWIAAFAAIALATGTAIAQAPLGEPYSRAFGAEAPGDVKTLVFVLHGDAPFRGIAVDLRILPGKPHDILNEPEVIPALRDLIAKVTKTR